VRPVFIIAPHRSGTTLLYRLLAASGAFNVVTAFHVLNRHRLLQLQAAGALASARAELQRRLDAERVTDEYGAPVGADHPEEYSYALEHQGRRPVLDARNLESFARFCAAVQAVQDPERPLLLKNPFDTANFVFISQALPEARFILLHRRPIDVIDSQIRLIRWMLRTRSPYDAMIVERYRRLYDDPLRRAAARAVCSERLPILFELVFRNVAGGCEYAVRHADRLGTTAISLTYPGVCRDPSAAVGRVLDFLDVRWRGAADLPRIDRREAPLIPEVERRRARIERRTAGYCRRFGV
jgi:hypothetical protein